MTFHKANHPIKITAYFKLFHQKVRGLGRKDGEPLSHLHPDSPHVLCLTEHHRKYEQIEKVHTKNCNFGAHYCRHIRQKGWSRYFVHYRLPFWNIDIAQHCKEQYVEIRALKLWYGILNICTLTHYRAPSGNFSTFLHKLDTILQSLHQPILHFIIWRDININPLNTKRRPLYLKTRFVPRSKHFSSRL